MQAIDYPPVQQALDRLKALSADAETRQLTKRFGPLDIETSQRLQSATPEQLERWLDRILDAPTLAAVFAEH